MTVVSRHAWDPIYREKLDHKDRDGQPYYGEHCGACDGLLDLRGTCASCWESNPRRTCPTCGKACPRLICMPCAEASGFLPTDVEVPF